MSLSFYREGGRWSSLLLLLELAALKVISCNLEIEFFSSRVLSVGIGLLLGWLVLGGPKNRAYALLSSQVC